MVSNLLKAIDRARRTCGNTKTEHSGFLEASVYSHTCFYSAVSNPGISCDLDRLIRVPDKVSVIIAIREVYNAQTHTDSGLSNAAVPELFRSTAPLAAYTHPQRPPTFFFQKT
jgi:hypothetical protein